ncbi:MAG: family 78 glycoside hydrolase catalytic domain [Candidatus Hodarchaeota archaeon]
MKPTKLRCEYLVNPLGLDILEPRLSWVLDIEDSKQKDVVQTAYQVIVSSSLEKLERADGDIWDTGRVASDQTIHVVYKGKPLSPQNWCFWRVKVWDGEKNESIWEDCEIAYWQMGLLSKDDWNAKWIGGKTREPKKVMVNDYTKPDPVEVIKSEPSPLLRKSFTILGEVNRAILYVTALGEYECRLNGNRVGDHILAPEWTDYNERVQYQAYDVTDLVKEGENVIGAILADGWYMGHLGPGEAIRQRFYGKNRRLLLKLVIEDGSGDLIDVVSDNTWRIHENGPIRSADHFLGETYDARLELPGWDVPGFDDSSWAPVVVDDSVDVNLVSQKNEPIKIFQTLEPVGISEPSPGVYIFNMGQNLVGWCKIKLKGERGQEVKLRYGEMLEMDGTLHVENLRLATSTDVYILDGGEERWLHPRFTFHGFQYVEVTGIKEKPAMDSIKAIAFTSSCPEVSSFECSNPMLNQLWKNTLWTQRDNQHSIPTDCPQRNERMGWTGDAQAFSQTAIYNMDMAALYTKFVQDLRDAQGEPGMYPDFAPHPFNHMMQFTFGPGWGDAGVIIPWRTYVAYEDKRLLAEHFESMSRYIDLIQDENPDFVWKAYLSNYGDWLNGDTIISDDYPKHGAEIHKVMYATLFYYLSTSLVAKMAKVLGRDDDHEKYSKLAENVKSTFISKYKRPGRKLKGDKQAVYAMCLGFGILLEDMQDDAVKHMVEAIHKYDDRISTGFVSTIQMMIELSNKGQNEMAYKLVESSRFPSWLYSIKQGATTIWERWDGFVKGRGFQGKGMNSFNHYTFGSVVEWMNRVILGINFDEEQPGMKHVIIKPRPGGTLKWVKGHYDSIRGRIRVEWNRERDDHQYLVEIPPNTSGTVEISIPKGGDVLFNDQSVTDGNFIKVVEKRNNAIVMNIKSGIYEFTIKS